MIERLRNLIRRFGRDVPASAPDSRKLRKARRARMRRVVNELLARMGPDVEEAPPLTAEDLFKRAEPPKWIPTSPTHGLAMDSTDPKVRELAQAESQKRIAMDSAATTTNQAVVAWAASINVSALQQGVAFLGYPFLAQLALRPEYRRISEIIAKEMTRKWGRVTYAGEDAAARVKVPKIEAEIRRLKIKSAFRKAAEVDGYMGRAHLYFDLGKQTEEEMRHSIGNADALTRTKVPKDSFRGARVIEPMWVYPAQYNSTDPLGDDYYRPEHWYVQGRTVHATRVMPMVSREVSDILKPAFAFGGLSLSQMAKPYIDNWLRDKQSISDLLHSFTVFELATDLSEVLQDDDDVEDLSSVDSVIKRMELFAKGRDNRGVFLRDKNTEEFGNVSAPLSTLDALQAQSQEHIASVVGIPLIKLLGITPSGLNASTDNELRCFYDWIEAQQEAFFSDPMQMVLTCIQLSLFGEVDPAISFKWSPLWTLTKKEEADVRKTEAETDQILIDAGSIDNIESRQRVAADPDTPYQLNPDKTIDPPDSEQDDGDGEDLSGMDLLTPEQRAAAERDRAAANTDPKDLRDAA